jgi:hypothetical protein
VTWVLSTVISLLLHAVGPLILRGLLHLTMAAMATLVCGTALAAGSGLLSMALCSPVKGCPLATVLVGLLLGAVTRLAALVGLVAVALLLPLAITAGCLSRLPCAEGGERSTTIP